MYLKPAAAHIGIAEKKGSKEKIEKSVFLGFNRKTLQDNHAEIQSEITSLLSKIEEETELIKEDNLAMGKLISAVVITEKWEPGRKWSSFDTSAMESGFKEDDPPEWWGEMRVYVKDLISGTHTFPRMPTSIAEQQFPHG